MLLVFNTSFWFSHLEQSLRQDMITVVSRRHAVRLGLFLYVEPTTVLSCAPDDRVVPDMMDNAEYRVGLRNDIDDVNDYQLALTESSGRKSRCRNTTSPFYFCKDGPFDDFFLTMSVPE